MTPTPLADPRLEGAACAGKSPLFDSRGGQEPHDEYLDRVHYAQTICATCPVLAACRAASAELPRTHRYGIWAGHDIATTRSTHRKKHAA